MRPSRSEWIQMGPNTSDNLEKLANTSKKLVKTSNNFANMFKKNSLIFPDKLQNIAKCSGFYPQMLLLFSTYTPILFTINPFNPFNPFRSIQFVLDPFDPFGSQAEAVIFGSEMNSVATSQIFTRRRARRADGEYDS